MEKTAQLPLRLQILSQQKQSRPSDEGLLCFGLPERIWTFDLQSRSLTRYPAVPRAEIEPCILYHNSFWISTKKEKNSEKSFQKSTLPQDLGLHWSIFCHFRGKIFEKAGRKTLFFSKKLLTSSLACVIIAFVNGVSPSGKATDSDSVIT